MELNRTQKMLEKLQHEEGNIEKLLQLMRAAWEDFEEEGANREDADCSIGSRDVFESERNNRDSFVSDAGSRDVFESERNNRNSFVSGAGSCDAFESERNNRNSFVSDAGSRDAFGKPKADAGISTREGADALMWLNRWSGEQFQRNALSIEKIYRILLQEQEEKSQYLQNFLQKKLPEYMESLSTANVQKECSLNHTAEKKEALQAHNDILEVHIMDECRRLQELIWLRHTCSILEESQRTFPDKKESPSHQAAELELQKDVEKNAEEQVLTQAARNFVREYVPQDRPSALQGELKRLDMQLGLYKKFRQDMNKKYKDLETQIADGHEIHQKDIREQYEKVLDEFRRAIIKNERR